MSRKTRIILNLKPQIEAQLIAEAASQGLSVEQYLEKFIEEQLINQQLEPSSSAISILEWEQQLLDFITAPLSIEVVSLSDDAISRDSIY